MKEEMDKLGIVYGGTGARVRPLVCCKKVLYVNLV